MSNIVTEFGKYGFLGYDQEIVEKTKAELSNKSLDELTALGKENMELASKIKAEMGPEGNVDNVKVFGEGLSKEAKNAKMLELSSKNRAVSQLSDEKIDWTMQTDAIIAANDHPSYQGYTRPVPVKVVDEKGPQLLSDYLFDENGKYVFENATDTVPMRSWGFTHADFVKFTMETKRPDMQPVTYRLPGTLPEIRDVAALYNAIRKVPIVGQKVSWVEEASGSADPAYRAEAANASESEYAGTAIEKNTYILSTYTKVTLEALRDQGMMRDEIDSSLTAKMYAKIEAEVWKGAASNAVQGFQSYGLAKVRTAKTGSSFKPDPTKVLDNVTDAMEQVLTSGKVMPNLVVVGPALWSALARANTGSGGPLTMGNPAPGGGGWPMSVWGIPMVVMTATAAPVANAYLGMVGNTRETFIAVPAREQGVTMSVGTEGDDFKKRVVTVLANAELQLCVRRTGDWCMLQCPAT